MRFIVLFLIFAVFPCSFSYSYRPIRIRVLVLSIFKPKELIIRKNENLLKFRIYAENDFVRLKQGLMRQFNLKSDFPIVVEIPGKIKRAYMGNISIFSRRGFLYVINDVPLKDYLASVVASEMGFAQMEALKAQAVLARTKALYFLRKHRYRRFHLTDLTDSQVYKGLGGLSLEAKYAVDQTRGKILSYRRRLAKVFYFSTGSNATMDPLNVWGRKIRYLVPVKNIYKGEVLSKTSPHFKEWVWRTKVSEVADILGLDSVDKVEISSKDENGNVVFLRVLYGNNYQLIRAEKFRILVGRYFHFWGKLKSASFSLDQEGDNLIFKGRGLGHGVGLCQWGAKELSEKGLSYRQILKFYFPRLKLKSLRSLFHGRF